MQEASWSRSRVRRSIRSVARRPFAPDQTLRLVEVDRGDRHAGPGRDVADAQGMMLMGGINLRHADFRFTSTLVEVL
jgi:hypothetical protein